jgi:iron(III) transport system substrate-binding protein
LLGYLSSAPGYGIDFYRKLKANGAVQADTPTDALTGVEQGRYRAGVTLANAAYADRKKGSPIEVAWPRPGGVAIYAPIGITTKKDRSSLAPEFASYAASPAGQKVLAAQDTYVTSRGLSGPPLPSGSPVVFPDWTSLFATYKSVLSDYAGVFGG